MALRTVKKYCAVMLLTQFMLGGAGIEAFPILTGGLNKSVGASPIEIDITGG